MLRCFGLYALLAAGCAYADNYPRQPAIDALHYRFHVTLSDGTDEIVAECTAELRFLASGVRQVFLDLASPRGGKGMTVTAVDCHGATCRYEHARDRLSITLD